MENKLHKNQIVEINAQKKAKEGKLYSRNKYLNGRKAKLKFIDKQYVIEFEFDLFDDSSINLKLGQYYHGVKFMTKSTTYKLGSFFIKGQSTDLAYGVTSELSTEKFNPISKYYYQLFIPLDKAYDFHNYVQTSLFSSDLGIRSRSACSVNIDTSEFDACCIKDKQGNYYLSIESAEKQIFKIFLEKSFAFRIALGYITGKYIGGKAYFFCYPNKLKNKYHFKYSAIRDSILSSYSPIHRNAYAYSHVNEQAKKYDNKLRTLTRSELENLCSKIFKYEEFSSLLLLILESSVASLLLMPSGFSIALESLVDIILTDIKLKEKPIKSRKLSKQIRDELNFVISKYEEDLGEEASKILRGKIGNINQITNKTRLLTPFKKLGIKINEKDLEIINTRNEFLHGRIPKIKRESELDYLERTNKDLYYCSMRFYVLLNLIILKWIGYENRVVNYPKIHEEFTQIFIEEEIYRSQL